jgi:predicted transcriptional regulator
MMEDDLLSLTAKIVSALAGANDVEADQLPFLITSVYQTLAMVGHTVVSMLKVVQPAVSTKASLFSDHLVCLECGQEFQILRRHIAAEHRLTPEQYRVKWGLPHDYPMVSADYAAQQSRFAKARRSGRAVSP